MPRRKAPPNEPTPSHPSEFHPNLDLFNAVIADVVYPTIKQLSMQRGLLSKPCCIAYPDSGHMLGPYGQVCLHRTIKAATSCKPPGRARIIFRKTSRSWRKLFYMRLRYEPSSLFDDNGWFAGADAHGEVRISEGPTYTVRCPALSFRYEDFGWHPRW